MQSTITNNHLMITRRRQARLAQAHRHAQALFLLQRRGFYVNDLGQRLDEAAYRAQFRHRLQSRLGDMCDRRSYTNAGRAMDILRRGEASRWFFARNSRNHAGDDRRGIVHHLRRWARRYGVTLPEGVASESGAFMGGRSAG